MADENMTAQGRQVGQLRLVSGSDGPTTTVSGGASALQHTNRHGVAFHLHQGKTKTGKPKYYVAKTVGAGALAEMPAGFEFVTRWAYSWWEEHGATPAYVSDLTELCEKQDLMLQARGEGSARSQQSRLGRALQGARDRVFGDLQVVVVNQDRKKRTLYALNQRPPFREAPARFSTPTGMASPSTCT